MRVLLSTRGSRGDVHPILSVASALQHRGHEPLVCVPPLFLAEAEQRGLRAVAHGEDSQELMQGFGRDWSAVRSALSWISRSIEEQFDYLLAHSVDADVLVASTNELVAPSVAEHRGIPFVRISFAPMMSSYQSNSLLPWQGLPPLVNRLGWALINVATDLVVHQPIHRRRAALGLPRLFRAGDYVVRRGTTLLAMSPVLSPPCPSWQGRYRYHYCGQCHDEPVAPLPEALHRFLGAGDPPVYVGLGSAKVDDPARLTAMVREAALLAGCRVVLGAGWTGLGAGIESSYLHVTDDVDHQALFPRVAGVVHHGGSGTTHTAARAGVPQLVLPQLADQYYWGHRIHELGLGPKPIPVSKLGVSKLAGALGELLDNPSHALRAASLGRELGAERGSVAAAELIEEIAGAAEVVPAPVRAATGS